MLYPNTLESKLGFDKIRELIKQACISPLGQDYVDRVRFSDNHALIDKLLRQTYEFKQIVQYESDFPQSNYIDVREQLSRARVEGLALTEAEFFDLKLALRTIQDCLRFLEKREDETPFPYLKELAGPVAVDKNLVASLDRIIDDRGLVRDSASPELSSIRRRIISEQANLRKRLDTIVRQARQAKASALLVENILAGVFGAFVGGDFIVSSLNGGVVNDTDFKFSSLAMAVAGAVVMLLALKLMRKMVGPMRAGKSRKRS